MYSEGNPAVIAQARRRRVRAPEEKEKMEQNKKTGYIIYDFMTRDMGLSGVALRVYALIYSFTAAGGDCHGSIEYIAKRVEASYKSVQISLKYLVEKGYVTKKVITSKRPNVYVAVADCRLNHTKLPIESVKIADNNKEDNKDNYLPTNNCYRGELRPIEIGAWSVRLTLHQYVSLLRAIGILPAIDYIRKLDRQITAHPERTYPNHYKTIITWARQDYRIDSRGEEILES